MNTTDATIEIECGECNEKIEGIDAMVEHILDTHPTYTPQEAVAKAGEWMEAAYEKIQESQYNQLRSNQKRAYRADQNGR